jgi:1-acyl-sn-glycerol-3-phosphate acyltransferase
LALTGWRVEGEIPGDAKLVIVAAPHTSYWDFSHMIGFGFAEGIYVSVLMKASLFWGPLGVLLRGMGGLPVERSRAHGLVESTVRALDKTDEFLLVIAPEGTRGLGEYWKSGFYHVARGAGVPIAMGFLDYGRRTVGVGPVFWPSGDVESDVAALQAFYADKQGKYPQNQTPPRLQLE